MNIIVKSGDDLRQEQFASQLINEFNQIFKIEKVDCWLNTYEILATGNNVGIIECVPDTISIDQLKKTTSIITTLSQFYEFYYKKDTKGFN
jgi:phosphatidylinositol 4-kinase